MGTRTVWYVAAILLGIAVHSFWPFTPLPHWAVSVLAVCVAYAFVAGRSMSFLSLSPGPSLKKDVLQPAGSASARGDVLMARLGPGDRLARGISPRALSFLLLCFLIGIIRFDITIPHSGEGLFPWRGSRTSFVGRVVTVSGSTKTASLAVAVTTAGGQAVSGRGTTVVVYARPQQIHEGSLVTFACTLIQPALHPPNVSLRGSYARRGIWHACAGTVAVTVLEESSRWDIRADLAAWRHRLTERIHAVYPADEAELVAGILYGDQSLDPELRADIQRAGLMHLVAVSGSNVTIVVTIVAAVLLALGCTRRQSFIVTTVALVLFTLFVGASASVVRAAVMGWLALYARELGRKAWTDHLLLVTAVLLCILNPWQLCFDAGFALSFLAMWGLLAWTPLFEARLAILPKAIGIRTTVATTLGATLMTVPYSAWAFGQMTLVGLLTNVLALPLVPWTMLWGALGALAPAVSVPGLGLARLIIRIAQISRLLPWFAMQMHGLDLWWLIACYLLIWRWWMSFREKRVVDSTVGEDALSALVDSPIRVDASSGAEVRT